MEGRRPSKKARQDDARSPVLDSVKAESITNTHIYDLGDCLHEVARHLPLNSCLRSRLASKAFAVAFGWSVRELMQLMSEDPQLILRDLKRCSEVYPAAESLMLVLDKYEDMPRLQAVVDGVRLEGALSHQRLDGGLPDTAANRDATPSGAGAASVAADSAAGPGPSGGAAAPQPPRLVKRRTSEVKGANTNLSPGQDVPMARVNRLSIRCNINRNDTAKERQQYMDKHARRPAAPLLQLLGLPTALLELLQEQNAGPLGTSREGHGVTGPMDGEMLLDLGFLARMSALTCLRLAVPLDLRTRPLRPWLPDLQGSVGGLAAVAALRQLRRLDLLPINGLTSVDLAPLGELGGSLEHLELYLDDAATLHWHRRPEGYVPPDPGSNALQPGPMMFMSSERMRNYEYATRVHPAWSRLNSLLSCLVHLTNLAITGTAPFWLPMGQHLLAEHPHIVNLYLSCTTAPAEFSAMPIPEPTHPQPQPQPQSQSRGGQPGSLGYGWRSEGGAGTDGAAAGSWSRASPGPCRIRRHLRVMVRHSDGNTLLEDAGQLLPLQPLALQDEVSLDICGMGSVRPSLGAQIRELVASLPVRSLVMLHSSWTDPRVATEVLGALGVPPESAAGSSSGRATQQPGLRRLQLWSKDKEAFDVSNRVLTPTDPDNGSPSEDGSAGSAERGQGAVGIREGAAPGPQELVIHGVLPDTLGPLLPPSLKRLSLANRIDGALPEGAGGALARRQAVVQVSCLPEGLEALDMQNMSLEGNVPGRGLPQLSNLSLHSCALADLEQLALGPRLRRLALFRNSMERSSMEQLADRCPGIVELNLQEAFSPDPSHHRLQMTLASAGLLEDVQHICRLTRLESLALPIPHSCEAMQTIVPHLAGLPSLHSLMVQGLWDLRVPALTCLTLLKRLEWLRIHMVVDTRCFSLKEPKEEDAGRGSPAGARRRGRGGGRATTASRAGQGAAASGAQRECRASPLPPLATTESAPRGVQTRAGRRQGKPAVAACDQAGSSEAGAAEGGTGGGEGSGDAARGRGLTGRPAPGHAAAAAAAAAKPPQPRRSGRTAPDATMGAGSSGAVPGEPAAAPVTRRTSARAAGAAGGAASALAWAASQAPLAGTKRRRAESAEPAAGCTGAAAKRRRGTAAVAAAGREPYSAKGREGTGGDDSRAETEGAGGAGPSCATQSGANAQPAGTTETSTPYDAHTVSRHLYDALVQDLPHTRVAMKLITITFKATEDAAEGGGGGGGGNEGGGDGGGGAPGGGNGPPGAAGAGNAQPPHGAADVDAEMLAVVNGAAAHAGVDGAGGGGGGGGAGGAAAAAFPLQDGEGEGGAGEAIDAALGDVGMLIFGFAMAALGVPPPPQAMAAAGGGGGAGGGAGGGEAGGGGGAAPAAGAGAGAGHGAPAGMAAAAAAAAAAVAAAPAGQGVAGAAAGPGAGAGGAGAGADGGGGQPGPGPFGCVVM